MTAPVVDAVLTAAEAAALPLGRLLSRRQVLLWLDCTAQALDEAVAAGRVLAVQYADGPERYPHCQFNHHRCPPGQTALVQAAFAALDQSGALAACWLASSEPVLHLTWRGALVRVEQVGGWPVITVSG